MVLLQKKKEILQKLSRTMATVFCALLLVFTVAGCGKVEEPIPVQLSSGNVEELQNGTIGETEDDPKEVSDGEPNVDTDENAENGSENNVTQKASQTGEERKKDESSKEPDGQDDSSDETIQQTGDAQPQSVGNAELEGNVRSIGADCFVAARHEVWTEENASYAVGAAPGYEAEEDLITVYANQNCVWEFETVKNGGINPEDVSSRKGSFADLQEGIAIHIKGSWQSDGSFLADRIMMMEFV